MQNWPVLSLSESPDIPLDKWRLEVVGLVEKPFALTWNEFMALPQVEDVRDGARSLRSTSPKQIDVSA